METVTLKIDDMHCKSCVSMIESKINSLKGIESIKVNLAESNAEVTFDPDIITTDKINSEIRELGYSIDGEGNKGGILKGVLYGLVPHIGCIGFLIFSILGVTAATSFFKPLLMNPHFFYILIVMSLLFATASAAIYLKRNGMFSFLGIKKKWKYLSVMYGTTIAVNLLLFMVIFPYTANFASANNQPYQGYAVLDSDASSSELTLKVSIPCPGHAPLITGELNKIEGVTSVKFGFPNYFDVEYDSSKASKQEILSLEVFKTYKATVVEETAAIQEDVKQPNVGGCCGSCGSSGSCGCGG